MNAFELTKPVEVTKRVVGLAGTAVGLTGVVAREAVHAAGAAAGLAGTVVRGTAHALRTPEAPGAVGDAAVVPPGPTVVRPEPHAPEEPPVDVVVQALAAEAAADRGDVLDGAGVAHEPRGASRDEEHGEASLQRAEVDELDDEVSATLDGEG